MQLEIKNLEQHKYVEVRTLPSVDILEKGWMSETKFKLFFKHNSSAACVHVDPISGDKKTLWMSSFDDMVVPEFVRLIILILKFTIFFYLRNIFFVNLQSAEGVGQDVILNLDKFINNS